MASIVLAKPDIGLVADFAATRLEIPHLRPGAFSQSWDEVSVHFYEEGDEPSDPVPYRGSGRARTKDLTARFPHTEHAQMVALLDLFAVARMAPDGRLMLRTNRGLVSGLDEVNVGTVPAWQEVWLGGMAWDVTFTFAHARHTVGV